MTMGFAVYHCEKGKGSGGGLGNHIDRTKGKEHSYRNADPERKHLNSNLLGKENKYTNMTIPEAINSRIENGYKGKKKPRKDAVKYVSHILTGSHKEMISIFNNPEKRKDWLQKNYDFMAKEFGSKNIVRFTLHLDEKTPHVHAVTVPLTQDGRLSAREIVGNRKDLQSRQDRYAEMMQPFGLERGIRRTGIRHTTEKEYYATIEKEVKEANNEVLEPSKGLLGGYKENDVKKQTNALINAKIALRNQARENKTVTLKLTSLHKSSEASLKESFVLGKEILDLKKKNRELDVNSFNKILEIVQDPIRIQNILDRIDRGELKPIEKKPLKTRDISKGKNRGYSR